jgi:hypothetical protein
VEPSCFNFLLDGKYYTTKLLGGAISTGSISWSNGAPRPGGASCPRPAESLCGKIRTYRTTLVVQLMVEKSAFPAPPVADVVRRAIPTLARYREPSHSRSIFEIAVTLVPFVALWVLAWAAVHFGYWELSFLLGVPTAGFLVRLFMIQHDCGHGSFFRYRPTNDWVGRFLGVLTLTPSDDWRRAHATHHANSGHLDRRGVGDIDTLTVGEFQALAVSGRLRYRLYRHPLVMFGLGAAYHTNSSCVIGSRFVRSAAAGTPGSAQWRPIWRSPSRPPR